MNDFCDLLGTPYAPVSKIGPVNKRAGLYIRTEFSEKSFLKTMKWPSKM